ncbi:MAG: putative MAPEG superfamily protein [Flavobacteriales bacterium]|jgi:uncharacterized MAPEG superfamily protein
MIHQELLYLALYTLFTACMWVPYIINRIMEMGLWLALKNPQVEQPPKALWARRAQRAHLNSIENLVIFAPLAVAIDLLKLSSSLSVSLCMLFFVVRILHYFSYVFAIPLVRTVLFFSGFLVQVFLAFIIVRTLWLG